MKQSVIIVPEFHIWDRDISSIKGYRIEINSYINKLFELVDELPNPTLIFDGDIFHQGMKYLDIAMEYVSYFEDLNKRCNGRVYSVIGNHEMSYAKGNIFWMISDNKSTYGKKMALYGKSIFKNSLIHLVDTLRVGDTEFVFGHSGLDLSDFKYDEDITNAVVVSHNNIADKEVQFILENKYKRNINKNFINYNSVRDASRIPVSDKLRYVFVGHMHTAYSSFNVNESIHGINCKFVLRYLGSLGRPTHAEYNNDDLERCFPVLSFENDKFVDCTEHLITLKYREDSVDETKVLLNREKYHAARETRQLRNTYYGSNDPMEELLNSLSDKPILKSILTQAMNSTVSGELRDILRRNDVKI